MIVVNVINAIFNPVILNVISVLLILLLYYFLLILILLIPFAFLHLAVGSEVQRRTLAFSKNLLPVHFCGGKHKKNAFHSTKLKEKVRHTRSLVVFAEGIAKPKQPRKSGEVFFFTFKSGSTLLRSSSISSSRIPSKPLFSWARSFLSLSIFS